MPTVSTIEFSRAPVTRRTAVVQAVLLAGLAYGLEFWTGLGATGPADAAVRNGMEHDNRTFSEVVADSRAAGRMVYPDMSVGNILAELRSGPVVLPGRVKAIPLGGVANADIVMGNEGGQYIVYRSDRHGFNNPPESWERSEFDAIALGDSFTEGCCVALDKSYAGLLRRDIPGFLNLGMHSSGPLVELAVLREYSPGLKAKQILWFYNNGDMGDLEDERQTVLSRYLDGSYRQDLASMQEAIDRFWTQRVEESVRRGALLSLRRSLPRSLGNSLTGMQEFLLLSGLRFHVTAAAAGQPPERTWYLLTRSLDRAKRHAETMGARLIFVYIPGWDDYEGFTGMHGGMREKALASARGLGLNAIDVYPALKNHPSPTSLFSFTRSHFTEEGHRMVYAAISEGLRRAARDHGENGHD